MPANGKVSALIEPGADAVERSRLETVAPVIFDSAPHFVGGFRDAPSAVTIADEFAATKSALFDPAMHLVSSVESFDFLKWD
jgi:hypothetical protein